MSKDASTPNLEGKCPSLREQRPVYASTGTKIRLSILSAAIVDALGFANEFASRFAVDFLDEMKGNRIFTSLPAAIWTDDTSMMLCLARSIATVGGCNEVDQMDRYMRWNHNGYLSSIDRCFDIGIQVGRAINIYHDCEDDHDLAFDKIKAELGGERNSGNGSLMRILPIGLVCWRDKEEAKSWARKASATTHPNTMCVEACQLWTCLIAMIQEEMNKVPEKRKLSKLHFLKEISTFPFTDSSLREALTLPQGTGQIPSDQDEEKLELWYYQHHPLLRLIKETQQSPSPSKSFKTPASFPYVIPSVKALPSSGYVLHTIVAALYCFFATRTFEEGALMAVNLCDDADTVGTVYAGLAGCWYSSEENAEGIFWTEKVRRWREVLQKREVVEKVAEELLKYERSRK